MAIYNYGAAARGGKPLPFNPLVASAPDLAAKRATSQLNAGLYANAGYNNPGVRVNIDPITGVSATPQPDRPAPMLPMPQASPMPQPPAVMPPIVQPSVVGQEILGNRNPAQTMPPVAAPTYQQRALDHAAYVQGLQPQASVAPQGIPYQQRALNHAQQVQQMQPQTPAPQGYQQRAAAHPQQIQDTFRERALAAQRRNMANTLAYRNR